MAKQRHNAITDVAGIRVGHAQDRDAITGCTVILCEEGAVGGVDQRGGAPGTRETDLLRPLHSVQEAHAILLSGGSAYGLDAAGGVMRYLEEKKIGVNVGVGVVPIVPSAILFDLGIGDASVRPDAAMAYAACEAANDGLLTEGSVGAGTGCTVGKMFGPGFSMMGGIGTASTDIGGGIIVGALVAVNAVGDVLDPETGTIIAGMRTPPGGKNLADTLASMKSMPGRAALGMAARATNTIIGVVATNAKLTKEEVNKVAQMAHNGLARTIRPAHTMMDGDTIFALATGKKKGNVNAIGAYAAEVVAQAIVNGVQAAESLGGVPSATSFAGNMEQA